MTIHINHYRFSVDNNHGFNPQLVTGYRMNNSIGMSLRPNRQHGGALLVAMILIFMLSIMGVSSMKGATLERRMASNSIQTATTFQNAESTSEMALNNTDNLDAALNVADFDAVQNGTLSNTAKIEVQIDLKQDIGIESEATIQYVGYGPAYGYSSNFVAYRFRVEGRAKIDAIRAEKHVTQGAYRIAPAPKL